MSRLPPKEHSARHKRPAPDRPDLGRGLQLEWCLGLNAELAEGTVNLSTGARREVCYASGHTVVVFDFERRRQRLLQGHPSRVSALCFSEAQGVLATADEGAPSMLVVWRADSGLPLRTILCAEELGVAAIDVSRDGERLLTLGRPVGGTQRARVWRWRDGGRALPVEAEGVFAAGEGRGGKEGFRSVKFNRFDPAEFVATSREEVRFFRVGKDRVSSYVPNSLARKESAREQGQEFSQTVFLPEEGGNVAVTGTEDGSLVVWDIILIMEEEGDLNHRREVKSISLFGKAGARNPGVSLLALHGKFLVVGTSVGSVRFYDFRFRIVCWFEDLGLSRITSVSFSLAQAPDRGPGPLRRPAPPPADARPLPGPAEAPLPPDDEEDFDFPEFVVCDVDARLTLLRKSMFHEIDAAKRQGTLILQGLDRKVLAVACAPNSRDVAVACANSRVYEWRVGSASLRVLKSFKDEGHPGEMPTCLAFCPGGAYLAVGTSLGNVFVRATGAPGFGPTPLLVSQKKKGVRCELIRFAPDGRHFAVSDELKCVSLFKLGHKYDDPSQPIEWVFAAKVRAHTARINDLCFSGDSERLFSVSDDMHMAEYNLARSRDALFVAHLDKVESEDPPTACIHYAVERREDMVLVANAGFKLKLWNVVNQQRVCRLTCLGPTFAGPISSMCLVCERPEELREGEGEGEGDREGEREREREYQKEGQKEYQKEEQREYQREGPARGGKPGSELLGPGGANAEKGRARKNNNSRFCSDRENGSTARLPDDEEAPEESAKRAVGPRHVPADKQGPSPPAHPKYLAFATADKVIGLIRLPLDGNPSSAVAIIAHCGRISHMEATRDCQRLLTAGDADLSLNVWRIDYDALAESPLLAPARRPSPALFPALLEGGAQGQLYRDLKDFFYYCQIRRKEENTTRAHKLDGRIPLKEIPNLMTSLGHYPTLREIENVQNEVRYSRLHHDALAEDLDLETFVKLFVNHRPAYGLTADHVADSVGSVFRDGVVGRQEFLGLLAGYGEKLQPEALQFYFATLMGLQRPAEELPETFDVKFLIEKVLGFELRSAAEEGE